ncbi:MAG TPA: ABC transporter ATP-binding protein [Planctomycetota bacterium]|nr:ABC transporter ATP-binding protein [Planctomycetota bacterium]
MSAPELGAKAAAPVPQRETHSDVVLRVEGLNVYYGGIHAVKNVSLEVRKGELTTLIGSNGAGKTTTLKAIIGLHPPMSGRVIFENEDVTHRTPHINVRNGLVLCPEGRRIFPDLTVDENLDLGAYIRNDAAQIRADIEKMHGMFPILKERCSQMAGTLSGGEQQMLAIARALMARPRLLMLDEPSLGLAPLLVKRIFQVLKELRDQGVTILLVEQNARQALDIADRAYCLETGKVCKAGGAKELAADPEVLRAYLGG